MPRKMSCSPDPDWFRTLAERFDDVVFRYRLVPTAGVDYLSPRVLDLLGRPAEDFYSDIEQMRGLVVPEDLAVLDRILRADPEMLAAPRVLRLRHAEGRIVCVEHRVAPVVDPNGSTIALEGIARDVTEPLTAHNRLRDSERHLRQLAAGVEKARESERTSVARELHDELGQSLTALKMELSRTARSLVNAGVDHESVEGLQAIVGRVEVATETVRRLATSLRPPALDHLGLVAAIELEAGALSKRTGIRCRVGGNRRVNLLDPAKTTSVFRIVQEALTNVVRHASASAIDIQIDETPAAVRITVQDNGRGITGAQLDSPSAIGLLGMRERADLIGATLSIGSRARRGTQVVLTLAAEDTARGDR
jgi:two-component system, NarL family, sensor histidine kinase UhpB